MECLKSYISVLKDPILKGILLYKKKTGDKIYLEIILRNFEKRDKVSTFLDVIIKSKENSLYIFYKYMKKQ